MEWEPLEAAHCGPIPTPASPITHGTGLVASNFLLCLLCLGGPCGEWESPPPQTTALLRDIVLTLTSLRAQPRAQQMAPPGTHTVLGCPGTQKPEQSFLV